MGILYGRKQIHFAHHRQIGHRKLAAPIPIRVLSSQAEHGFMADYYAGTVRLRFLPPCLIEIVSSKGFAFLYYCIPQDSGHVRTIAIKAQARRSLIRIPRWIDHLRRNSLVDGDLMLMRSQEREMHKALASPDSDLDFEGNGLAASWQGFYMPTTSDRLILEMRKWLIANAPSPSCAWYSGFSASSRSSDRQILLDRWKSHTEQCSSCSAALRWVSRFRLVLKVAFYVGLLACALSNLRALRLTFVCASLASLLASTSLAHLERRFRFVDGTHELTHGV